MTGTETILATDYIPLWIAVVTSLSGFGVALAQYVWSRHKHAPKIPTVGSPPVSKEYEKTMAVMMGRIADTLEKQSLILEKIERHIDVMIQTAKK